MQARQWAIKVIEKLQEAGFQALLAGGCVRDGLLEIDPKDFDVATMATPSEVQELFGHKKTLAIGKSFGVITIIGPKSAGNIEVATFRRDGGYSDGRRPDSVEFTDAREDALRRDFTINGMFFDPVSEEVIDFVGGRADLDRKLIRAIGDPDKRIEEDRLRMLRGVRFAATYDFQIEASTMVAIQKHAADIGDVSPERIGTELRKMLSHRNKSIALERLIESGLWAQVLPSEIQATGDWNRQVEILKQLDADFPTTLAAILRGSGFKAKSLQSLWRLTNEEVSKADWILTNETQLARATTLPWSELQPLLISPHATSAVTLLQSLIDAGENAEQLQPSVAVCRQKLSLQKGELNPAPLVAGDDLMALGISPGPQFKQILDEVRKRQLDGELADSDAARKWIVESFK